LEVLARTHGGGAERIDALLDQVGLAKDARRKVKAYSTGMRQRLGVAAALLNDPEIVILDEPVNGLDVAGIQEMRRLIRSLAADGGKTVFLSSHLLSEVQQVCDRVAIIHKGEVVRESTVAGLLDQEIDEPQGRGRPGRTRRKRRSVRTGRWSGRAPRSRSPPREPRRRRWRAGWSRPAVALFGLTPVQRNLEDVFLALTQEDPADA
jgi:ABC-2 type transport system ATP-binding protein